MRHNADKRTALLDASERFSGGRGYDHLLLSAHGITYTTRHPLFAHTTQHNRRHVAPTHRHKFRQAEERAEIVVEIVLPMVPLTTDARGYRAVQEPTWATPVLLPDPEGC